MLKSLKFRLTVMYAGIFAAFLVVFSVGIYFLASSRAWKDFDRDLERDARVFSSLVHEEWLELQKGEHTAADWLDELKPIPNLLHASASLTGSDGKIVFQTSELTVLPSHRGPVPGDGVQGLRTEYFNLVHHPGMYRIAAVDLSYDQGPPMVLEFSRSTVGLSRFLNRMGLGLLGGIPLLILLSCIAGYFFIKRTIQPVDQMSVLAREISAGDLARRIPLPASQGEFRQLALTLNAMLSRLEEAFGRMRTFTANAAHELKTPVAAVRSALETSVGRSPREMEEAIRDALEDLGRLTEITDKLFLLARADAGRLLGATEPVDLAEIAGQVVGAFEGPAGARRIAIHLESKPATMKADGALLRRAIHNLVENAVKYGKEGGEIRIRVGPAGVEVRNDGPSIPPEHLSHVFDRFFRVDPARSDRVPGAGLGLAIVKSIVEAHGGSIGVASGDGRTSFTISLPGIATSAPVPAPRG
jgi:two-component system heavy metal sensor histidine kinase CusS